MRNPKDFFAKWQGSEDEQFAAYVRVLSEIGEEFGLDYETCYEFCHRVFGENSNYKTGMCFIKQVMDTISLQLRGVLADMNGELLCRK
jgi:hypothetical protein